MCQGTACYCHIYRQQISHYNNDMIRYWDQVQRGLEYPYKVNKPNKFFDQTNIGAKVNTSGKVPTAKTYIAISQATGNVIGVDSDLAALKKLAASAAYKEEDSVIIFSPVAEIAPKRDVVETAITLL